MAAAAAWLVPARTELPGSESLAEPAPLHPLLQAKTANCFLLNGFIFLGRSAKPA